MCWLSIQEDWWRLYRRDTLAGQTFDAKSEDEILIKTSSPQQSVKTKTITRKPQLADLMMSRWLLPLILAFQALISWLLLQNTVFQDEALYVYAGGQGWRHWFNGLTLLDPYTTSLSDC